MTNEQRITELERIVKDQQSFINSFKFNSSIPKEVDDAIKARYKINERIRAVGLGSAGSQSVFNSFNVTVPANPSGTLKVDFNGTEYELLYK